MILCFSVQESVLTTCSKPRGGTTCMAKGGVSDVGEVGTHFFLNLKMSITFHFCLQLPIEKFQTR